MGRWAALGALLRFARGNKGKSPPAAGGGALGLVVGAVLGWLAGRRGAIPPVRATGAAENLVRPTAPTRPAGAADDPEAPAPS